MDALQEKNLTTSRGLHYRYYTSPAACSPYAIRLCHGFPDSARLYQFTIPHLLATGLRIIIPDLLGYGGTSKPTDPSQYTWPLMSTDLTEILAAEDITSNVIPIGHDWGSAMAQRFYMLHKPLCAGLVTLAVALMPPTGEKFDLEATNAATEKMLGYPLLEYWNLFLPKEGVELMDSRLESMWYVMHGAPPDTDSWMRDMFCTPNGMRDFLEQNRQDVPLKPLPDGERLMQEWIQDKREGGFMAPTCWYRVMAEGYQNESEKWLSEAGSDRAKVTHPYLFVGCKDDVVCRADAIEGPRKAGLVPDCTVKVVDSGHWVLYEKPDEVAGIIVEWLGEKGFC